MSMAAPVAVGRMFPDRATIQTNIPTRDTQGTVEDHWTTIASDVPAQLSSSPASTELRKADGSWEVRTFQLILYGWYDLANEAAQILTSGRTFDVRGIAPDSYGVKLGARGWTVLMVEERESVGINANVTVGFSVSSGVFT